MKVTGLSTSRLRRGAHSSGHDLSVLQLATDEGLVGIATVTADLEPVLKKLVEEVLWGEDPRAVTALWENMASASAQSGGDTQGMVGNAIAALDVALWDLKAKAQGEPLWKTLGGSRPHVNTHLSVGELADSDDELFTRCSAMAKEFGFRGCKLAVRADQASDLRRLDVVKRALGQQSDNVSLMIDAAESWSPKEAIRRVCEMESRFDLTWVERPARSWDFLGHKRVSSSIRAAVCAGEGLGTPGSFLPHFQHHALDIIKVNPGRCGITGALQLADAAFGFELPVVLSHSPGNIHAHLGAVMPYCMSMEVVEPVPLDGVFTTDVQILQGWAVAGERPGNGLALINAEH